MHNFPGTISLCTPAGLCRVFTMVWRFRSGGRCLGFLWLSGDQLCAKTNITIEILVGGLEPWIFMTFHNIWDLYGFIANHSRDIWWDIWYMIIYIFWLVIWNHGILWLSIYWECHHPNWRSPWFFRGVGQPPTRIDWNSRQLIYKTLYSVIIYDLWLNGPISIALLKYQGMRIETVSSDLLGKTETGSEKTASVLFFWEHCNILDFPTPFSRKHISL